jgi:hypothetical protein
MEVGHYAACWGRIRYILGTYPALTFSWLVALSKEYNLEWLIRKRINIYFSLAQEVLCKHYLYKDRV